jgi:hypothetical protein
MVEAVMDRPFKVNVFVTGLFVGRRLLLELGRWLGRRPQFGAQNS